MDCQKIISFIVQKRKELNLSQNYIADKIGYSSQLVYSWEKGKSLPDLSVVSLICDCLKITIDDFFNASNTHNQKFTTPPPIQFRSFFL